MSAEADRVFLARDVYGVWKQRVQRATGSVRVFTPYFDKLLDRLLSNAVIEADALSVITDLSPESGALDYRCQLLGARALLERGIELRSLPRLHAKVLLCDGQFITIGSQNFTSYARESKETTSAPALNLSGSTFLAVLDEWYADSTPVTLDFIEMLLNHLGAPMEEARQAQLALSDAFDEEWELYLAQLEDERRAREALERLRLLAVQLAQAVDRGSKRRAQPELFARLQHTGGWNGIWTLLVDGDGDLTRWPAREGSDDTSTLSLAWLNMYPLILNPSGRMGFARVAQHRISYVRDTVRWTTARTLFGEPYGMTVNFPEEGLEDSNLYVTLTVAGEIVAAELHLRLRFDGPDVVMRSAEIRRSAASSTFAVAQADRHAAQLETLAAKLWEPAGLETLVGAAFEKFKYSALGIENVNARSFFPGDWVRISVIEIADRPVLVVTPN